MPNASQVSVGIVWGTVMLTSSVWPASIVWSMAPRLMVTAPKSDPKSVWEKTADPLLMVVQFVVRLTQSTSPAVMPPSEASL